MAKKDAAAAVLGMLSTTGASTRPTSPTEAAPSAEQVDLPSAAGPARRLAAPAPPSTAPAVPRTLRLRASTAAALRDAWLDAKRDDVLLSHQDFASDLLDAALHHRTTSR